jgi:hypothetical protein
MSMSFQIQNLVEDFCSIQHKSYHQMTALQYDFFNIQFKVTVYSYKSNALSTVLSVWYSIRKTTWALTLREQRIQKSGQSAGGLEKSA